MAEPMSQRMMISKPLAVAEATRRPDRRRVDAACPPRHWKM